MFKIVALFTLVAVASAHYVPHVGYHIVAHHPVHYVKHEPKIVEWKHESKEWEHKEEEKPANYDFKYEVHDEKTGDIKRQSETAVNGAVKGQYSLIDSDGYRRVVEYTADDHHGFQAVVKREPTHHKIPEPIKKIETHDQHWW